MTDIRFLALVGLIVLVTLSVGFIFFLGYILAKNQEALLYARNNQRVPQHLRKWL